MITFCAKINLLSEFPFKTSHIVIYVSTQELGFIHLSFTNYSIKPFEMSSSSESDFSERESSSSNEEFAGSIDSDDSGVERKLTRTEHRERVKK